MRLRNLNESVGRKLPATQKNRKAFIGLRDLPSGASPLRVERGPVNLVLHGSDEPFDPGAVISMQRGYGWESTWKFTRNYGTEDEARRDFERMGQKFLMIPDRDDRYRILADEYDMILVVGRDAFGDGD